MPHEPPTTEQSYALHWLEKNINFKQIRRLCNDCFDLLKETQLGKEQGSLRQSNGRRTLSMELRKALPQVANLKVMLDPISEDEIDTVGSEELKRLLSEVCHFIEGITLQFGLDSSRQHGEHESLGVILTRLRASTTSLSDILSDPVSGSKLFTYDSNAVLTQAINVVKEFNRFLRGFTHPIPDWDDLVDEPPRNAIRLSVMEEPSNQLDDKSESSTYERGERCFKHAQAAMKAMFSKLSTCNHRETMVHDVRVQLPMAEKIQSRHDCSNEFSLEMFLSGCPGHSKWQEARITRKSTLSQFDTSGSDQSICNAIRQALDLGGGLDFHILEDITQVAENHLIIPWYDYLEPKYHPLKPTKSLLNLLKDGYLRSGLGFRRLKNSNVKGSRFEDNERRSLAIQVVFGVVLCLRYGSNMATWDPKRLYLLENSDGSHILDVPPYVSCVEGDTKASYLDLPDPDAIFDEEIPSHCHTFTKIAKTLLEIGLGECLSEQDSDANDDSQILWDDLWEMVQNFNRHYHTLMDRADCLDKFPYFKAAEHCLRFIFLYRKEVDQRRVKSEDVNPWAIAERIISRDIISELEKGHTDPVMKIDTILQTRSQMEASTTAGGRRKARKSAPGCIVGASYPPQQRTVKLFDDWSGNSEDPRLIKSAEKFFSHVDNFHKSFKFFVDEHGELPNRPIRIAILDTGINKDYEGINFDGEHMKDEWCYSFVGEQHNVQDDDGHGTLCASLLRKVAPDAEVYIVKVFSHNEFDLGQARNISKAIHHAVNSWDVHVISMSFGLQLPSSEADLPEWTKIKSEIAMEINSANSLFFAAASNEGENEMRAFPSTHPSVFCVHASDGYGKECSINPHHDNAENNIMVLGTGIKLLDNGGEEYVYKEGTSFATAIAAGLAACILDLTSRIPTEMLREYSKEMLRTYRGMRYLFQQMSRHESGNTCRFTVPWKLWKPGCWDVNSERLKGVWSRLNVEFMEAYDHMLTKRRRIEYD